MPPYIRNGKPQALPTTDLKLRSAVMRRHPELSSPVRAHTELPHYASVLDRWVVKQTELQEQGMSREDAFNMMEREYQEFRYRRAVERLVTLSELRRAQSGNARDELPNDEFDFDQTRNDLHERKVREYNHETRFAKYESLANQLDVRIVDDDDLSPLTVDELDHWFMSPEQRREFVQLYPEYKELFDPELEMFDGDGVDLEHPLFSNLDFSDDASVEHAVREYIEENMPLDMYDEALRDVEYVRWSELDADLGGDDFSEEADLLQNLEPLLDDPTLTSRDALTRFQDAMSRAPPAAAVETTVQLMKINDEIDSQLSPYGSTWRITTDVDVVSHSIYENLGIDLDNANEDELCARLDKRMRSRSVADVATKSLLDNVKSALAERESINEARAAKYAEARARRVKRTGAGDDDDNFGLDDFDAKDGGKKNALFNDDEEDFDEEDFDEDDNDDFDDNDNRYDTKVVERKRPTSRKSARRNDDDDE